MNCSMQRARIALSLWFLSSLSPFMFRTTATGSAFAEMANEGGKVQTTQSELRYGQGPCELQLAVP